MSTVGRLGVAQKNKYEILIEIGSVISELDK
jgi:hypothetical protein